MSLTFCDSFLRNDKSDFTRKLKVHFFSCLMTLVYGGDKARNLLNLFCRFLVLTRENVELIVLTWYV